MTDPASDPNPARTLRAQTVIYRNEPQPVRRALLSIDRAAELAIKAGILGAVSVGYGDASPTPVFGEGELAELRRECPHLAAVDYMFFNRNTGTAAGHNRLVENSRADFTLLLNPDVIFAPTALIELMKPMADPGVGMAEGRQLPIEHPKDYDSATGETGWTTGACSLIETGLFRELGGYDEKSFFLYCDDVDLSWRVRLRGRKLIFQPSALFFHDKKLSAEAGWQPSEAEKYYSAEAYLLMAHKWSRPDILEKTLRALKTSAEAHLNRAAAEFERRRAAGELPQPLDSDHRVSEFTDGNYARHRFGFEP